MEIETANSLVRTAQTLVAPGKGILAADESTRTIGSRFAQLGVENTERNRRDFREMLFTTDGIGDCVSGVILYDETLRQVIPAKAGTSADGTSIVEILSRRSILPGIKVDTGAQPLAGAPGETVTEGLDRLRDRLNEYRELGARFTKWRAVINVGPSIPSDYCIEVNAHALARYAALAQEAGLVPIVEPEVMMTGNHSIDRCSEVTEFALRRMYDQLIEQRVMLEGTLLKSNMVVSGRDAQNRAAYQEVAKKTIACLMRAVPATVPGVMFLSGGQGDEEATSNLNAIVLKGREVGVPWELSFSFARGLQSAPMKVWAGNGSPAGHNWADAQGTFQTRVRLTAAARRGDLRLRGDDVIPE